jgi:hypothetical protein
LSGNIKRIKLEPELDAKEKRSIATKKAMKRCGLCVDSESDYDSGSESDVSMDWTKMKYNPGNYDSDSTIIYDPNDDSEADIEEPYSSCDEEEIDEIGNMMQLIRRNLISGTEIKLDTYKQRKAKWYCENQGDYVAGLYNSGRLNFQWTSEKQEKEQQQQAVKAKPVATVQAFKRPETNDEIMTTIESLFRVVKENMELLRPAFSLEECIQNSSKFSAHIPNEIITFASLTPSYNIETLPTKQMAIAKQCLLLRQVCLEIVDRFKFIPKENTSVDLVSHYIEADSLLNDHLIFEDEPWDAFFIALSQTLKRLLANSGLFRFCTE